MKRVIATKDAPAAIGPYSQATVFEGKLVFCAGQLGIDPQTNELVPGGVGAQTERAMQNLKAVLEASLTSFANVVKVTIYLTDIGDFPAVNQIYARYFGEDLPPARSTVQVAALPKGALIEIDCIAAA